MHRTDQEDSRPLTQLTIWLVVCPLPLIALVHRLPLHSPVPTLDVLFPFPIVLVAVGVGHDAHTALLVLFPIACRERAAHTHMF